MYQTKESFPATNQNFPLLLQCRYDPCPYPIRMRTYYIPVLLSLLLSRIFFWILLGCSEKISRISEIYCSVKELRIRSFFLEMNERQVGAPSGRGIETQIGLSIGLFWKSGRLQHSHGKATVVNVTLFNDNKNTFTVRWTTAIVLAFTTRQRYT